MRRILTNLDSRWLRAASKSLCAHLEILLTDKIEIDIQHILAWVSFFPGEADLKYFINKAIKQRACYLPRTLEDGSMTFLRIYPEWQSQSEIGRLGIPEPSISGEEFSKTDSSSTIALVPGLAFDKEGNRLGRGKGYYDRFLGRNSMKGIIKVGVCWSMQMIDQVPSDSTDIGMDWIVHENGIIKTGMISDD